MARFLHTVWPLPGHLHPNISVAQALLADGHQVAFYTGPSATAILQAEGIRVFPFTAVDEQRVRSLLLAIGGRPFWERPRELQAAMHEWLVGSMAGQMQDLDEVLAEWQPDAIVCDPSMWSPILVLSELTNIPVAVLSCVAACVVPGRDGPIAGLPMRRPRTRSQRAIRALLRALAQRVGGSIARGASAFRQIYGLSRLTTSVTQFASTMPLYLVPSTPAFDYNRTDLPPTVQYVGPCLWDKPRQHPAPEWLTTLQHDRPLVYVTEGSLNGRRAIVLDAALKGLTHRRYNVVMTTGSHRTAQQLGLTTTPDSHVRLEQWVPHSDLFPRTDVVVTTGGSGTVLEALTAGLPLVIVPLAWDQPENAWHVQNAGAGIRLAPRDCSPTRLAAAVDRVLTEPTFHAQARRLAADFAQYRGPARAAQLLGDLVRVGGHA